LTRRVLRFGAVIGAVTVSALAVAPAFAAAATSQATAQSLQLSIGGQTAISQKITATNNGTTESRNDASTVPLIADLLTGNNVLGAGVAPQDAHANTDGTSYACAGLAGTGGGIATVGHSSCDVKTGQPLTLGLGTINLDLVSILGSQGALTGPLSNALSGLTLPVGTALDDVVTQLRTGLADTPLGQIRLDGALSVIEGTCTANPDAANGDAEVLDTSGDRKIPIRVTLPNASGGTQTLNLADLDVPLNPRPGGYDLLVNLDDITAALFTAIEGEVDTAVGGAISKLNDPLKTLLGTVQDQIVTQLVNATRAQLLQPLSDNLLKVILLDRTYGDGGRSVDVKALRAEVLPAAAQVSGASLISGTIGHVTCGPNTRATADTGSSNAGSPHKPKLPDVPTVVDSGVAGHGDHTAQVVLGATGALLLLAGTAGLLGYRRMLGK